MTTARERPTLRAYQAAAIADTATAIAALQAQGVEAPRVLAVSRTGTGKTVLLAAMIEWLVAAGLRVGFLVRDRALVDQTAATLNAFGLEHGVHAAGHRNPAPAAPVQICMQQTLAARGERPPLDFLVVDEAHGAFCRGARELLAAYPHAPVVGATATPERGDGTPMAGLFHRLVQVRATFRELVTAGALVDVRVIAPADARRHDALTDDPLNSLRRFAPLGSRHKPVIFTGSVAHAERLAEQALRCGYRARAVHGGTRRADLADAFTRFALPAASPDALDVLVNCALLTQGWDMPCADVGILARGVSVWSELMQICGRFLRPFPGKPFALVHDLMGSVHDLGFPFDDRTFSLDRSATETAREALEPLARPVQCRKCFGWGRGGRAPCPFCGAMLPAPPPPKITKAAQAEFRAQKSAATAATNGSPAWLAFSDFVQGCRARGMDDSQICKAWHRKTGEWPRWKPRMVPAATPTASAPRQTSFALSRSA